VKLLPSHQLYVEVFGGAANLLLTKPASPIEVYNDRYGALVNLFETIRRHPLLFLERAEFLLYSRELALAWQRQVSHGFVGSEIDQVEKAVRTYYSLVSGFAGDREGSWAFSRDGTARGGSQRWTSVLGRVAALSDRLRSVVIDCLDFRECIHNWDTDKTLFFLDPPYFHSVKPLPYDLTGQDHQELAKLLEEVKGKWLLIYNDRPEVRELYYGYEMAKISSSLSSQKVLTGGRRKSLRQLLIANYPLGEHKPRSTAPAAGTRIPS
jgi:DNA adenine methylase